jgi:phosphohistidine phosphatase
MYLYLIRHAHALDAANDAVRPLSPKGRKQVRRLARLLRGTDAFAPAEIWHSSLTRAVQTAELLAKHLDTAPPLRPMPGLAPGDSPRALVRRIARAKSVLAIVGHEPHLSALASLLVAGVTEPPVFVLKKSAVLALERVPSRWVVRWHLSPELLA